MTGAITDLTHVLELEPNNADCLALRGDYYVELGDYEAARRDYDEAIDLAGGSYSMLVRYGTALSGLRDAGGGQGSEATRATQQPETEKWLHADPQYPEAICSTLSLTTSLPEFSI